MLGMANAYTITLCYEGTDLKKSDSTKKFSENHIINMLDFFIDNIFAMFGGRVFQQTFGKPIGTHCVPLLTDLFLYSYEADFIHGLLIEKNRNETSPSL
jgi:hypothetical protein